MAKLIMKPAGCKPMEYPVSKVTLRAEKVTEQTERWFLEFLVVDPFGGAVVPHEITFTTAELDDLFLAFEMLRPVATGADSFLGGSEKGG